MRRNVPTGWQDVLPPLEAPVDVVALAFHTVDHAVAHAEGDTYSIDDVVLLSTVLGCGFAQYAGATPPPVATGAVAGIPGTWTPSGAAAPATLAGMGSVTATPATAWTTGQHMVLGDGSHSHWTATAWAAGDPAAATRHRK